VLKTFAMRHSIIIGAAKSGTTSLYNWLIQHPKIIGCLQKEPSYFSGGFANGSDLAGYKKLFSPPSLVAGQDVVALEASTAYTKYPEYPSAAAFIRATIPDSKLIYIMRNPFDRIRSHYNFTFANNQVYNFHVRKKIRLKQPREIPELAAISDYFLQLSFYDFFFDRGQMLLLDFDEIKDNPLGAVQKVFRFLDVEPCECIAFKAANITSSKTVFTSLESVRRLIPHFLSSKIPLNFKHAVKTVENKFFGKLPIDALPCHMHSLSESDYDFYLNMLSPSMERLSQAYGVDVARWGFK